MNHAVLVGSEQMAVEATELPDAPIRLTGIKGTHAVLFATKNSSALEPHCLRGSIPTRIRFSILDDALVVEDPDSTSDPRVVVDLR